MIPIIRVPLEEYLKMLQNVPIIHRVHVLFDDRPKEVSIRVEYLTNMTQLHPDLLEGANEELSKITAYTRIENCQCLVMTYLQKEVIV